MSAASPTDNAGQWRYWPDQAVFAPYAGGRSLIRQRLSAQQMLHSLRRRKIPYRAGVHPEEAPFVPYADGRSPRRSPAFLDLKGWIVLYLPGKTITRRSTT